MVRSYSLGCSALHASMPENVMLCVTFFDVVSVFELSFMMFAPSLIVVSNFIPLADVPSSTTCNWALPVVPLVERVVVWKKKSRSN